MNITLTTTEPITIEGVPVPHEELQALVSKHKPKARLRDGYREPKRHGRYFYIDESGRKHSGSCDGHRLDHLRLAYGNVFTIERNCDLTIEANNIHHDLIRWIDLHGARAKLKGRDYHNATWDGKIWERGLCTLYCQDPFKIDTEELCDLFITENTDKLNRLKAIEEELAVSLYQ